MVEREGKDIQEHMDKLAEEILKKHGFTSEGRSNLGHTERTSDPYFSEYIYITYVRVAAAWYNVY